MKTHLVHSVLFLLISSTFLLGETNVSDKAESYQNQQRAIRLVLMRDRIKQLDDAPMRCFLRAEIARFIYEKKVSDYINTADAMVLECFEEIDKNAEQFSTSQSRFWTDNLITLLRTNSRNSASKAAQRYLKPDDLGLADLQEIDSGGNLSAITGRLAAQIASGDIPPAIFPVFQKIQSANPALSYQILEVLLSYFESRQNLTGNENTLNFFSSYFLDESTPLEIRNRYLRFSVKLAGAQLTQDQGSLFEVSYNLLTDALPVIKLSIPAEYDQALSISLAMKSKISATSKERDEAYKRIEESKDKLATAISEAEAAEHQDLKDSLWLYAFQLGIQIKKFRTSVDCLLKYKPDDKSSLSFKDQMLLETLLPNVLKERDVETAQYVLKNIDSNQNRGSGMIKLAATLADAGNKIQAYSTLQDALTLVEKDDVTTNGVRIALSAVPVGLSIEKSKAFESANSAISMANHLRTPSDDEKVGTPARVKYVDEITIPNAFNLVKAFKILAKLDVSLADSTSEMIQSNSWKMATGIVVETERIYPLPPDSTARSARAVSSDKPR